jgi:hypothetical protein
VASANRLILLASRSVGRPMLQSACQPILDVMEIPLHPSPSRRQASLRPIAVRPVPVLSVLVVGVGLAVGIGTQVLQGELPGSWNVLANSGVVWAMTAFLLGAVMPSVRSAALAGAVELVIASVSYYQAVAWFEGISSDARSAVIWSLAGVLAGSAFGAAGRWARQPAHRETASAAVAGLLAGEGIRLLWFVGNDALRPAGVVELLLAAGVAIASLLCGRRATRWSRRSTVLMVLVSSFAATLIGGILVDAVFARS